MTTLNQQDSPSTYLGDNNLSFADYMKMGYAALEEADISAAHDAWRAAATLDPYREEVWQALLSVVDNPEDRIVCLKNIIAINPIQAEAREALRLLETREEKFATQEARRIVVETTQRKSRRSALLRSILIGVVLAFAGIALAVGINLLLLLR